MSSILGAFFVFRLGWLSYEPVFLQGKDASTLVADISLTCAFVARGEPERLRQHERLLNLVCSRFRRTVAVFFPDRSYISNTDWCSCCLAHDLAYWRGGTEQDRLNADIALKNCVQQSTKNPVLANLMFEGVRLGGTFTFFTSYRWGYGWKWGVRTRR